MLRANSEIGPYTLIKRLGKGAFGVVWLAEKRTAIATSQVAIKIALDEEPDLEAIKQEASLSPTNEPATTADSTKSFEFETVKVDASGKIVERTKKTANQFIEDLGQGIKLEMVEVPSGTFTMGSASSEAARYDHEGPQHQVNIESFYLGKYEVTQAQYQAIIGNNPSNFKGNNLPVVSVTWNEAIEFCKKLSAKMGKTYRLPSEAEWEYAARAGTTTPFAFGETINTNIVNYYGNYPYGQAAKGEYRAKTIAVGSLGVANAFGLYDMHGNVWEWCQDIYQANYNGAPTNSKAW